MAPSSEFESTKFEKSKAEHSNENSNLRVLSTKTDLHKGKLTIYVRIVFKPRFPLRSQTGLTRFEDSQVVGSIFSTPPPPPPPPPLPKKKKVYFERKET